MKKLLVTTAALGLGALVAGPAHATLQIAGEVGTTLFTAVDNNAPPGTILDTDPTPNILTLANQTIAGVAISGSVSTALLAGTPELNSVGLAVRNTTAAPVRFVVAISQTGFVGPANHYDASASGLFQNAVGGTATNKWWDDPADGQGATAGSCTVASCAQPGTLLNTSPLFIAATSPDSYSFDFTGGVSDTGLFSMTMEIDFTLPAGNALCVGGITLICPSLIGRQNALQKAEVPEPATLGLLGAGLVGLGLVRRRRRG